MSRTRIAALLLAAVPLGLAADEKKDAAKPADTIKLFNGKDLTGWHAYLNPKEAEKEKKTAADIFTVTKDGLLRVEGSVFGYLLTEKEYGDYVLTVEWKWGADPAKGKSRNSGVFVHVSGPDKIWPKGVEAQLLADHAGEFWLVDGFKLTVDKARQNPRSERNFLRMIKEGVEKPVGEWNKYVITCKGDTIKLEVNGKVVNEGSNAEASKGKILLQSEGAEVFFRNIELTPLK
jgi:hypothetical protein